MTTETDLPVAVAVEHDGLKIAALDWGGDGEPLLLLHPNGFCAGIFDPLARRLLDRYRPVAVDLRAHGGSDVPPNPPDDYAFALLAGDVLAVLNSLGIEQFVALGESLGGGVAVLVDVARPGVMRRLALGEAIAFDVPHATGTPPPDPASVVPGERPNFMADIARKRRSVWPDRATVRASYGGRRPLDAMAPDALDAYVRWGFVDRPDGQIELACPREAEATLFEMSAHDGARAAWTALDRLHAPAVVIHGSASNLPGPWFRAQADRAGSPMIVVDGGHFFVQEDSARAEVLVREHLA